MPVEGLAANVKATPFLPPTEPSSKLQLASQLARSSTDVRASLTADQKAVFLELNGQNKGRANPHSTKLVESKKDVPLNLSR